MALPESIYIDEDVWAQGGWRCIKTGPYTVEYIRADLAAASPPADDRRFEAAKAIMAGLVPIQRLDSPEYMAREAVEQADALLAALDAPAVEPAPQAEPSREAAKATREAMVNRILDDLYKAYDAGRNFDSGPPPGFSTRAHKLLDAILAFNAAPPEPNIEAAVNALKTWFPQVGGLRRGGGVGEKAVRAILDAAKEPRT